MKCLHCFGSYGEANIEDMSLDQWKRLLTEAAEMGVFSVNLAGGEPSALPFFPEVVAHLAKVGLHFTMTTNGLMPQRGRQALYAAADYIIGVKVSLDGHDAVTHGGLRRTVTGAYSEALFNGTVQFIREMDSAGAPITIATCLHRGNIDHVDEMAALIENLAPVAWSISTLAPAGRAWRNYEEIYVPETHYSVEYWQGLKRRMKECGIALRYVDMPLADGLPGNRTGFSCPAATSMLEVYADGTLAPCPMARVHMSDMMTFPNAQKHTLADAWHHESTEKFREMSRTGCEGCSLVGECGRCVPQSIHWFGEPNQPPPYCLSRAEALGIHNAESLKERIAARVQEKGGSHA